MYERAAGIIAEAKQRGYHSIAVICKDEKEADWVGKWLEGVTILPIRLTKGLEFDVAILWNPDMEKASSSQSEVKLLYVAVTRALHELYLLKQNIMSSNMEFSE